MAQLVLVVASLKLMICDGAAVKGMRGRTSRENTVHVPGLDFVSCGSWTASDRLYVCRTVQGISVRLGNNVR
jgi:hypothetical protein